MIPCGDYLGTVKNAASPGRQYRFSLIFAGQLNSSLNLGKNRIGLNPGNSAKSIPA